MALLEAGTRLHVPELYLFDDDGLSYAIDPAAPNWIVVEPEGRRLINAIAGRLIQKVHFCFPR